MSLKLSRRASAIATFLLVSILCFASAGLSQGQTFSSGSTGADGPLNITAQGVTNFDPRTVNPTLHADGNLIYNFTTINIAAGSTLRLSGNLITGPIFFLASGAVQIAGTIDLSGENGLDTLSIANLASRVPAAPGTGGFAGGVGGICAPGSLGCSNNIANVPTAQPGNGPAGGAVAGPNDQFGFPGNFSGTQFLIPLIGGSGGGGHNSNNLNTIFCGGGAGGGAILIASSISITMTGNSAPTITANGGRGGCPANPFAGGGAGSGGAIRLMAPIITHNLGGSFSNFNPRLLVAGGVGGVGSQVGGQGRVRLEAFQINGSGSADATPASALSTSLPISVPLPAASSIINVTSIAGIPINANPFIFPDVSITTNAPVPVVIQARSVPLGAALKLFIYSETGPDQVIDVPALQGTLQQSTSTVNIAFPQGGSRGYVKATWTQ
jgi:hypothetical protein